MLQSNYSLCLACRRDRKCPQPQLPSKAKYSHPKILLEACRAVDHYVIKENNA